MNRRRRLKRQLSMVSQVHEVMGQFVRQSALVCLVDIDSRAVVPQVSL